MRGRQDATRLTTQHEDSSMTRRILLTVGGLLLLSAGSLAAQEMKVTCKDGTLSKGGQGACSSHGGIGTKNAAKVDEKVSKSATKVDEKVTKAATKSDAKMAKADAKAKGEA